ncbi:MAG: LamG-like jellyroll fold domain-containing protein, partial [Dolichospermum sp.]
MNKTTTLQLKAEKQLKALNFDGINNSVTVNNLSLNNNSGTWEAWVQKKYWQHNNDALLGNGIALDMAGSFYISLHNVVGLHCRYGGINQPNNVYAATPLTFNFTNNSWHHFAFTWQRVVDSTILKLYVDGVLANRVATPLLLNMGNNFLIGGAQNGSANFGEGAMKEIRFWNTAKTDAEIALNQLVGLEGTETGLLAYYRMNETSGSIAADASPNNKNATLINFNASTAWLGDTTAICFGNTTIMQQKQIISIVDSGVAIVATHKTSDTLFRIQYNNANTPISYSVRATGSNILPNFINVPTTAYTSAFINVPFIGTGNYGIYDFELTMQFAGGCEINYPFKLTLIDSVAKERRGNALSLNGVSQYVSVPDNDSSLSSYTLESWVYWSPANANDVQFLFGKAYEQMEVHFGGIGNNGIRFIPTNGVFIDAYNAMPTNQWVHLAVVYNIVGSLAKIYVNGIEVASSAVSSLNPNSTNDFRIGIRGDGTYAFKGMIDEFRVWNYARTATEIRETMHLTLPNGAIGLVQYFQFNESEAYTLALENIGYKHANMIGASRASSGANVSNGISFTITNPAAATNHVFTGTGVELNFGTAPNGNIVVSKLDGTPPGTQVASNNPFSKAYWIVNNFGTTTTGLNVTAKVGLNSGQLIYADQLNPASIQFNQRKNNTLGAWNKTKNATTVNSSANELIVQEIDSLTEFAFSRFLLNTWSLNSTNSNWHYAANWSNEVVPANSDSVTVLAESAIMPVLDSSINIYKLNNNGQIQINHSNTLTVTDNITGNGTITNNNGRIAFAGTTAQNIANKINTKDVTVNNVAGVTILDTVKISGVLTPTSGTLYTNGKLVLQSNSISIARIAAGTGNYIDGAVTVERYIPAGNRAFRFLASPVTTTNFIRGNWQEGVNNTSIDYANNQNPVASYGMHITGSTTGLNGFDATQTGAASIFTFNNTTQSWSAIANTNATNLLAGNAYRLMVRGDRSIDL